MSFVGPRPALFNQEDLIALRTANAVHMLKPGLTGWAQVNGRNSISWSQKFALDVYYVEHISFLLDVRIFFMTIIKVFRREGINQTDQRPMEPFNGSN
jgi:lipopolysaccharide/colanic/teichoic acid biosynthesis glycosyltransferase